MKTRLLVLGMLAVFAGCSFLMPSPEVRWQRSRERHADTLETLYPTGTSRAVIRQRPMVHEIDLARVESDWFLELSLQYLKENGNPAVEACDTVSVPRGFLGMGLYRDYVFYSPEGKVVARFRRFVD